MSKTLALSPSTFFKGWLSALALRGERAIATDQPETRDGLKAVLKFLDSLVESSEKQGNFVKEYTLLNLRNEFLQSNTGAFDGVERALRNLQTSLVMSPNPDYLEMVLQVPESYADSLIHSLSEEERRIIEKAAETYLEKKRKAQTPA